MKDAPENVKKKQVFTSFGKVKEKCQGKSVSNVKDDPEINRVLN